MIQGCATNVTKVRGWRWVGIICMVMTWHDDDMALGPPLCLSIDLGVFDHGKSYGTIRLYEFRTVVLFMEYLAPYTTPLKLVEQ